MVPRQRLVLVLLAVIVVALTAAVVAKARARGSKPKVTLVAYYPFNPSHKPSVDLAQSMARKFPGKVTVQAYDFTTQEGREKWFTSGLQCAGILINGKTDWDVIRNGKREKISFTKREGILWTAADLEAVVKQVIADPTKPAVLTSKPAPAAKPAAEDKAAAAKKPAAPPAAAKPAAKPETKQPEAKPEPSKSK